LLQVWDTGPGIAEQHQRAIFEEFRRLDRTSPWGEQGLGLGLSICDRIARLLGLELGVRSRAGHGSVFSVRVPISTSEESVPVPIPANSDASTSTPASLVGITVLCIDNEPEILAGMSALMSRWGVRVLTAVNVAEARRAMELESPDVILADHRLGDTEIDGLELLQSLLQGLDAPAALITADHTAPWRSGPALVARAAQPLKPAACVPCRGAGCARPGVGPRRWKPDSIGFGGG
jgi:CheY-like chemotaxis protein